MSHDHRLNRRDRIYFGVVLALAAAVWITGGVLVVWAMTPSTIRP